MPWQIIDIGTVVGTDHTLVTVKSWRTEADRLADVNPRLETHEFDANRLAPSLARIKRNIIGQVKVEGGGFVDLDSLYEDVSFTVKNEKTGESVRATRRMLKDPTTKLETETVAGDPLTELMGTLDKFYNHLYADDARDQSRKTDMSDPAGVLAHPDIAAIVEIVKGGV